MIKALAMTFPESWWIWLALVGLFSIGFVAFMIKKMDKPFGGEGELNPFAGMAPLAICSVGASLSLLAMIVALVLK